MSLAPPSADVSPADNFARLAAIANAADRIADVADRVSVVELGLAAIRADAGAVPPRPGANPEAYASASVGHASDLPPSEAGMLAPGAVLAMRTAFPVDPDAFHALRVTLRRDQDVIDPIGGVIDVGVQWLGAAYEDAGVAILRRFRRLTVQEGPQVLLFRVPPVRESSPTIIPPRGARHWRPFVRAYDVTGSTVVDQLDVTEVTFTGVFAPDLATLTARLTTIEGLIAAGFPLATPILPSSTVANLPVAGTRGRKIFVSDGRAPNAAGVLEPANGGTGVEATDNGTKWVITGTNQQVQA